MSRLPTPSARRAMPGKEQHLHPLSSVLNTITSTENISSPSPSFQLSCYASQPVNFPPRRTALSLLHFPAAWPPSERVCHNVFSAPRSPGGFRGLLSGCVESSAELQQGIVKSTVTEQKGDKMTAKWSDAQANVLVEEWKARIEEVESRRNSEAWQKIVQVVNETRGTLKSVKQCKDKLRNMKQAYKDAKSNNMIETCCSPKRSPFYEEFDAILGSRPVVPAPEVIQVGVNTSARSTTSQELPSANSDSDGGSDEDELSAHSPGTSEKRRRSPAQTPLKKRVKVTRPKSSDVEYALKDVAEKILEMQSIQINALERAQARTEDLLVKLDAEQRRHDEEARCRDQDFFLRLAEIVKK